MLKLALRNLLRAGTRTALTLAAITLGVAGLIVAGGFVEDVYVQLGEATIRSQLGHLQIHRRGFYEQGSRKPLQYALEDPRSIVQAVAARPGVRDVMLRLNFSGLLNADGRADFAIVGEGIEPEKEARLGSFIRLIDGQPLRSGQRFGMLVGEGVARTLRLAVGSRATLLASSAEGALNTLDFEVVGIFRSFSKDYDARAVRIALPAAQELLATDIANTAVVLLDDTARTDAAKADLERALAARGVEILAWHELSDFYRKTIALYQRQFGFLQAITLVMVVLSVMNSVSMTAFERAGEFGTMRALGNRAGTVFRLLVVENALLGTAGALAGVACGLALAIAVSSVGIPMPPPPNAESGYTAFIRIVPSVVAASFAVGVVATVFASLWPARRVARMPVVDALRQTV
jgi:putative ABC transport system permease protein